MALTVPQSRRGVNQLGSPAAQHPVKGSLSAFAHGWLEIGGVAIVAPHGAWLSPRKRLAWLDAMAMGTHSYVSLALVGSTLRKKTIGQ